MNTFYGTKFTHYLRQLLYTLLSLLRQDLVGLFTCLLTDCQSVKMQK